MNYFLPMFLKRIYHISFLSAFEFIRNSGFSWLLFEKIVYGGDSFCKVKAVSAMGLANQPLGITDTDFLWAKFF